MIITKHGHACLALELKSEKVIIDPGFYTEPMGEVSGVVAVVITHKHDDHCFEAQLEKILETNPKAKIFGTAEVAERLTGFE
ncbi:MAG: MBL fold metallo-hydrolase, partial [Actinomycetota bacterium]